MTPVFSVTCPPPPGCLQSRHRLDPDRSRDLSNRRFPRSRSAVSGRRLPPPARRDGVGFDESRPPRCQKGCRLRVPSLAGPESRPGGATRTDRCPPLQNRMDDRRPHAAGASGRHRRLASMCQVRIRPRGSARWLGSLFNTPMKFKLRFGAPPCRFPNPPPWSRTRSRCRRAAGCWLPGHPSE